MKRTFIMTPDGKTGGIEALFQLAHELNLQGHEAYLVPTGAQYDIASRTLTSNASRDYAKLYSDYSVRCTFAATLEPDDMLIVPEIFLDHVQAMSLMPCRKYIWWLSATNGFKNFVGDWQSHPIFTEQHRNGFRHLFQSFHAAAQLHRMGVSACLELKCYINAGLVAPGGAERKAHVLYNPAKDKVIWRQLEAQCPDMRFIPLANLDASGLRAAFSSASIYIDFGTHPGMDRLPREAALNRVVVVTGKRGAAGNPVDVPIESMFKFADEDVGSGKCAARLREIVANYPLYVKRQNAYRGFIAGQRGQFSIAVENIWGPAAQN